MDFRKILSLLAYNNWLPKTYTPQDSFQNAIYRIAEIKPTSTGEHTLILQVIGKSTTIECLPQEIMADDQMLEGFSKKDIRLITYYAYEQIKKPKYKVVLQEFCAKFNRMLFRLKKQGSDEAISKTANQIVIDKNLVNNLSQEDVCSISYIAGYEHSSLVENEITFSRQENEKNSK